MTERESRQSITHRLLSDLRPKDFLEATGPLLIASVFAIVLYGIQVPINLVVLFGVGLIYWPVYEVLGLILERGMMAVFMSAAPQTWQRFRNGLFPVLFVMIFIGLFAFKQWVWLIIFMQLMPLIFNPPASKQENEGCLHAMLTGLLVFIVVMLAIFSVPVTLSQLFSFPNVSRELQLLPGMLIIGIGYYLLMAVLAVLIKPLSRLS